jgi:hypothetical protein
LFNISIFGWSSIHGGIAVGKRNEQVDCCMQDSAHLALLGTPFRVRDGPVLRAIP